MWRYALLCVVAAACQFETSGRPAEGVGEGVDDDTPAGRPDAAAVSSGDASVVACVDADGDGFAVVAIPGAECGPPDCDDTDALVFPGQTGSFTTPSAGGSFDYNCDGVATPLAETELGSRCGLHWFDCVGTGWLDAVPACGEPGTWHRCEGGLFSCGETESVDGVMPCI